MKHRIEAAYDRVRSPAGARGIEWPTMWLILGCYAVWLGAGLLYRTMGPIVTPLLALMVVLHSSLQHEAIHRHPTAHAGVNEALVSLPIGLLVPFRRYRDLHLRHHVDASLTDPYDDPESFYLALADYRRLPRAVRTVLDWNNRLAVRMLIGPAIAALGFVLAEARTVCRRDEAGSQARLAWALHALGLVAVIAAVRVAFGIPVWVYLTSVYAALSLLAARSFCEHQWAARPDARTVIIEGSRLSLLFLNNNLHLVHHKHPGLPWYALPAAYRARRADWLAMNDGYVFRGYGAVLRRFGLRAKEPVAHPVCLEH